MLFKTTKWSFFNCKIKQTKCNNEMMRFVIFIRNFHLGMLDSRPSSRAYTHDVASPTSRALSLPLLPHTPPTLQVQIQSFCYPLTRFGHICAVSSYHIAMLRPYVTGASISAHECTYFMSTQNEMHVKGPMLKLIKQICFKVIFTISNSDFITNIIVDLFIV